MKIIISVMLAVMMLFGAMSLNDSAATEVNPATTSTVGFGTTINAGEVYGNIKISKTQHVIVELNFNSGKSLEGLMVYDVNAPGFTRQLGVTGRHLMLPGCGYQMIPGAWIRLPAVSAPEGMTCKGWEINHSGVVVGHGIEWQIPAGTQGQVLELTALYTTAEAEEDTLTMILGVLTKVFGTIVGILFLDGSSAAGVELVNKLLAGIM